MARIVRISSLTAQRLHATVDRDVLTGDVGGALVVTERLCRDDESHVLRRTLRYRVEADRLAECWLYDEDQALVDHLWR